MANTYEKNADPCKVFACDCDHKYQDSVYGRGNRLHNIGNKGYKCTVCGKVRS